MADWTPIDMSGVPSFTEQLAMSQGIELPPEPPAQEQQQQRDALDPPIRPIPQEHFESIDFGAPRVSTRSVSRTPVPPNDPRAEDEFLYSNDSNKRNSTGASRRYYDYDLVDTATPVIAPHYVKPSTSTDNEVEVLDDKKPPSPEPERPCLPLIGDVEEGKFPPTPEVTKEIPPSSNEEDCEPPSTIPGLGSPPPRSSPEPYNESSVNAPEFEQEQSPTGINNDRNDTQDEDSSQHDREVESQVPPSNGDDTLDANSSSNTSESQEQELSSSNLTESEAETGVIQNEEQNQTSQSPLFQVNLSPIPSEPCTISQNIHLSTPTSPMEFSSTTKVEQKPTESVQADESPTVVTRANKRSSPVEHQTSPQTASTSGVPPVKIKLVSVGGLNEFQVQNATSTSSNPTRNVKLDELTRSVESRVEGAQKRVMKRMINDKKQQEKQADKAERNKPKQNNDKLAQPQLSTQGKLCKNCKKAAVVDATWDQDYCSESCVVIHVKNVFQRFTEHLKKVNMSSSSLTKSTNSKNASSESIQRQLTNLMSLVTPSATPKEEPKTSISSPTINQS